MTFGSFASVCSTFEMFLLDWFLYIFVHFLNSKKKKKNLNLSKIKGNSTIRLTMCAN